MSSTDTVMEERQKLLGEGESGDEQPTAPPPIYTPHPPPPPPPPPLAAVKPTGPPPEYTAAQLPQYAPVQGMGYPLQVQMEGGQMVPATLVQDPSGKHMVYICDSGRATGEGGERPPPPRDFLGLALFGLICCCFPLGVIALIKSIEVNRRYNRGDYTGAARASLQAHSWGVSAVVFGVCIFFIVISLRVFFHSYHHYYYYY